MHSFFKTRWQPQLLNGHGFFWAYSSFLTEPLDYPVEPSAHFFSVSKHLPSSQALCFGSFFFCDFKSRALFNLLHQRYERDMLLRVARACSGELFPLEEHHPQNRGNGEVKCYDSESFGDCHIECREGPFTSWTEGSHSDMGRVGYG
jgi:hypothetical protein